MTDIGLGAGGEVSVENMVSPSSSTTQQNGVGEFSGRADEACSFCVKVDEENRNMSANALRLFELVERVDVILAVKIQLENERDQLQRQLDEKDTYIESLKQEEVNIRCQLSKALSGNEPLLRELNAVRKEKEDLFKIKEDFAVKCASSESTLKQVYDLMKMKDDELGLLRKQKEEFLRIKDELSIRAVTAETNANNLRLTLQETKEELISLKAHNNSLIAQTQSMLKMVDLSAGHHVFSPHTARREAASPLLEDFEVPVSSAEDVLSKHKQPSKPESRFPPKRSSLLEDFEVPVSSAEDVLSKHKQPPKPESRFPPKRFPSKHAPVLENLIPLGNKRPRIENATSPLNIQSPEKRLSSAPILPPASISIEQKKKSKKNKRPKLPISDIIALGTNLLSPLTPIKDVERDECPFIPTNLQTEPETIVVDFPPDISGDDEDIGEGGLQIVESPVRQIVSEDASSLPLTVREAIVETKREEKENRESRVVNIVPDDIQSKTTVVELPVSTEPVSDSLSSSKRNYAKEFETEVCNIVASIGLKPGFAVDTDSSGELTISNDVSGMINKLVTLSSKCKRKFIEETFFKRSLVNMKSVLELDDESLTSDVVQNLVTNLHIATKLFAKRESPNGSSLAVLLSDIAKCQRAFANDPAVQYVVRFAMLRFGLYHYDILKTSIKEQFSDAHFSNIAPRLRKMYRRYCSCLKCTK